MFKEIDLDQSGRISFPEFLIMISKKMKKINKADDAQSPTAKSFAVFDLDGNGYITRDELGNTVIKLNNSLVPDADLCPY